jgi:hypothetical protein
MPHQYNAGDVVTVFQISPSNELVIEGKATIRKRLAEVDEHYRVEFDNKPGMTCERFVDSWGQDDPEKYVQDFNRRAAPLSASRGRADERVCHLLLNPLHGPVPTPISRATFRIPSRRAIESGHVFQRRR